MNKTGNAGQHSAVVSPRRAAMAFPFGYGAGFGNIPAWLRAFANIPAVPVTFLWWK